MGFWDRFRQGKSVELDQPRIRLGRYTDSYKSSAKYKAWDKALAAFEQEQYLDSYRYFFEYLGDDKEQNVKYWDENGGLRFELYQGSKKITGFADQNKVKAESKVAISDELNVGFMRRLIEKNFSMEYCRFGLDEHNNIVILFDTYTLDGSPYKLYYALKEVAINADKQDDLLLEEFGMLKAVDVSHLQQLNDEEKAAKYNFIKSSIEETLTEVENGKLDFNQYPGAYVYLLLDLVYRLDYLTRPEGFLMERLEFFNRQYFAKDNKSTLEKAQVLARDIRSLLDRSQEAYYKEMYHGKSTFGITMAVNHDRVVGCIDNELVNMDFYLQNAHPNIALAIPGFKTGYCLFNYAVPKPAKELFELFYKITEPVFFQSLGYSDDFYNLKTKKLNPRAVKKAIQAVVQANKNSFPRLRPAYGALQYNNIIDFSKSYILMIRNADMTKVQA